jgi:DNA helicase-2/ATP-dependent DNA helicase PcrA
MARTFTLAPNRSPARVDYDNDLNDAQRAVATGPDGAMLVIAGAGSGKTRALTYRLAWLVEQGVDPGRILLMTFTNRAAREMVHRARSLVPLGDGRFWAGTFHHVANRLLREHGRHLGLSPDFSILDREDAGDLLAACVVETGVRISARRFPGKDVLLSMAGAVASTGRSLEQVIGDRHSTFAPLTPAIARVLESYEARKRGQQLLDYDDLLASWQRLLEEHPDTGRRLADHFQHVLVDEYQDTNAIQGAIVDRIAAGHGNVCVVGDDAQAIYSFRGASFENMLGFRRRWPDAVEHRLEVNYRSTPEILDLANASIACNRRRLPKDLRAVRPSGVRPAIVPCADHLIQTRFVAEYILHLLDQGRQLDDIAVLYRSHWNAMEIQLELQRRDIPFTVRGGIRFFEQAHIKDALSFLRLHHNGHDELAWRRVLRLIPRIGGSLAGRIWERIAVADDPVAEARRAMVAVELPAPARETFARFAALLETMAATGGPDAMLRRLLADFYGDHLETRYPDAAHRRQDIEAVADFAAQYHTVEAFLSDVALTGDFTGETCVDGPEEQIFVTLSTVHQAKGLEWPVVLVPWVADGRFPTDMAMGSDEDLEEERRVFHVAVTRARDELYLVVPQVWSNHRRKRIMMKPSRFLAELDGQDLTETMVLEGGA